MVIQACIDSLKLDQRETQSSWFALASLPGARILAVGCCREVLRKYGNMSSCTLIFVLQEVRTPSLLPL